MRKKFSVGSWQFSVVNHTVHYTAMNHMVHGTVIAICLLLTANLLTGCLLPTARANVYAPTDSIVLTVGCLDTTFLGIADPDSIWFKWFRDVGGQSIVDSAKVTSSLRTGFVRHKIKASDGSNNMGTYIAQATVYKDGKSGIKTWDWTVKAEFDSLTNAIDDANKDNFKATVVKIDGGYVGECTTLVNPARIDGGYIGECTTLVNPAKINGGYVGQCTTVVNEVNVISTDTMKADVLDKTNYSLTTDYMTKADSSLFMRTDWANVKNPTAYQNLSQTRFHFVDSLGEELTITTVDSVRKVYIVDSLEQTITAEVDTSQIKTMNENNLWGASCIWNYQTRTLTSGAGSGANSVVIRCKQSSDSSNIALAQIQVLDSTENSTVGLLTSDSQGRGFFALDNGTYCVRIYKPGWQFTVPETLKVSGDEDTTFYAFAFDPGSPPQPSLCRVYGWIYDINNQEVVGAKIEAGIKTIPLRYQNIIISPYYKSTTTDEEGYWYLDLYPNSALNPSDTKYIFFVYSPSGTILRIETTVPDQGSWELQW